MAKEKAGLNCDYEFYVGILTQENGLKFVTAVKWGSKECEWKSGAQALAMTKHQAIQLQMGLLCNGYTALVVEAPDYLEFVNHPALYEPKGE